MALTNQIYTKTDINYALGDDNINPRAVSILDGRLREDLNWEENGFELLSHHSAVTDWNDEDSVANTYYEEMEVLAKSLTDCDHALIAGHISRNPETAKLHADYAPIQYAHSDFAESYGDFIRTRYSDLEGEAAGRNALARAGITAADVSRAPRILVLQFWRNVGPENMDLPIAFCDAQSVERADLHAINVPNYADEGLPFDTLGLQGDNAQRHSWYTFPQMHAGEVVAFRTFDTACVEYEQPFWTPHSAFQDTVQENVRPRYSIEVRATCLFFSE